MAATDELALPSESILDWLLRTRTRIRNVGTTADSGCHLLHEGYLSNCEHVLWTDDGRAGIPRPTAADVAAVVISADASIVTLDTGDETCVADVALLRRAFPAMTTLLVDVYGLAPRDVVSTVSTPLQRLALYGGEGAIDPFEYARQFDGLCEVACTASVVRRVDANAVRDTLQRNPALALVSYVAEASDIDDGSDILMAAAEGWTKTRRPIKRNRDARDVLCYDADVLVIVDNHDRGRGRGRGCGRGGKWVPPSPSDPVLVTWRKE